MRNWRCEDGTIFTDQDQVHPLGWEFTKQFLFIRWAPKHYVTVGGKKRYIDSDVFRNYYSWWTRPGQGGTGIFE
jgi:hypothetical protein